MTFDPRNIAHIMGGDVVGRDSVNVPGPGHSAADRSLSIKINGRAPGGFVVFSHCGDNPIECRDYVRQRLGLDPFDPRADNQSIPQFSVSIAGGEVDQRRRIEFSQKIWQQSGDPRGTVVEHYLRSERSLELLPSIVGSVVRYHGRLKYGDDQYCMGMVCLMRNIKTDEPTAIHRTFLDSNGKKIDRRMLGIAKGAAIKIDAQPGIDGRLTIGEGFETSLASRLAGLGPAWALGSAGAMQAFPVVDAVSELTFLEENDNTIQRASHRAKVACTKRYLKAGKPVNVVTPRVGLTDFNDVWREAQQQ